jgi:DNA-binding transcriptional ArsR family regulator
MMEVVTDLEEPWHPDRDDIDLVTVLQALGDPVRLQLVRLLDEAAGAVNCRELQMQLPVAKSTASHHFKVLREAGVVHCELDGTRRYYTLRHDDLEARFPGLLASILAQPAPALPS